MRKVVLPSGVSAAISTKQKDELFIDGNDIQLVSQAGKDPNIDPMQLCTN